MKTYQERGESLFTEIKDLITKEISKSNQCSIFLSSHQRCLRLNVEPYGEMELVVPAWSNNVRVVSPIFTYHCRERYYSSKLLTDFDYNIIFKIADTVREMKNK